jgi:hypothetical protein
MRLIQSLASDAEAILINNVEVSWELELELRGKITELSLRPYKLLDGGPGIVVLQGFIIRAWKPELNVCMPNLSSIIEFVEIGRSG